MYVDSVPVIDIADLRRRGIQAVLTDLDNTLVPWQGTNISPEVRAWLKDAADQGLKLCIVSNTRSMRRLRNISAELEIPYVRKGLKPRRIGFRAALQLLDVDVSKAAVLGDQMFTDVLGGNRLGAFTILVRPMHPREFFGTKISRLFERVILRLFEQRGRLLFPGTETRPPGEHLARSDSQKESED
jgi:uncharacterized protein